MGKKGGNFAGEALKSLVSRIERLQEEKAALQEDIAAVFQEAKSTGFDTKIMREVLKIRRMDKHERDERETLVALYMDALGDLATTPLGRAAIKAVSGG
jgi:uncharacterized protein (UPF0335 family)